ncbi:alpha/beta hydrolase [Nonomuraea sp. CA-143628]|uniref:alpha/beta hydrolase n=1 Tax=Nonomuraea sp. CA-143628 TaxID=3239997 RepID=UPI003D8E13F8
MAPSSPAPLPGGQVDLYIDPRVFHPHFAGDLPAEEAALFAITQRPATGSALGEPAADPQAWHTIPSYNLISGADRIIPPAAQEFMAQRSGATIEVVEGASHLVFVSNPGPAVALIEKAASETAQMRWRGRAELSLTLDDFRRLGRWQARQGSRVDRSRGSDRGQRGLFSPRRSAEPMCCQFQRRSGPCWMTRLTASSVSSRAGRLRPKASISGAAGWVTVL